MKLAKESNKSVENPLAKFATVLCVRCKLPFPLFRTHERKIRFDLIKPLHKNVSTNEEKTRLMRFFKQHRKNINLSSICFSFTIN